MIKYFITKVKVEKTLWVTPKNWVILYVSKKEPKQTFYCKIKVLLFGLFWVTYKDYEIYVY